MRRDHVSPDERLPLLVEPLFADLDQAYAAAGPTHDLAHVVRVARLAEVIAREESAHLDACLYAALFHDVGRASSVTHEETAARHCKRVLERCGVDRAVIERAVVAIREHRFSSRRAPQTPEGAVLQDADRLDALGAVGVARAFMYIGEHGRPRPPDASAVGAADINAFALHYEDKLRHLSESLNTSTARALATGRDELMLEFVAAYRREIEA